VKVLVTGADGFIGKNFRVALSERDGYEVLPVTRMTTVEKIEEAVGLADAVVHLAGVNRPKDPAEFELGNADFTEHLCGLLRSTGRAVPVAYASSIQAEFDNPYGLSKLRAENHLTAYATNTGASVAIYRLANVFGKWCRPNYNSAVATFCHNIARELPVQVNDPSVPVQLVYVDDVVAELIRFLHAPTAGLTFGSVSPVNSITVGALVEQIRAFGEVRAGLVTERVGVGFLRALYSTYISYLEPSAFSYGVTRHADPRGVFVEMLKTKDSGQFSFFTAFPGVTRGGHYHHTKTEKFLVITGRARFKFRHILTDETHTLDTSGADPVIVETIPGWAHDITNIGDSEMVVMLWANEIFDRDNPDTISSKV